MARKSLSLRYSQPALKLLILSSQQFEIIIGAALVSAAENGDFDLVTEFVNLADHLFELGVCPGGIYDLWRRRFGVLLLLHCPCDGGAKKGHGLACASWTLDERVLVLIQAFDDLSAGGGT
jgi:hypothetical protein